MHLNIRPRVSIPSINNILKIESTAYPPWLAEKTYYRIENFMKIRQKSANVPRGNWTHANLQNSTWLGDIIVIAPRTKQKHEHKQVKTFKT